MRKLNKYELRLMLNLRIITFLCVVAAILNIALPVIEQGKFSLFILTQIAVILAIYVNGCISARGVQTIPISITFILRGFQAFIFIFWLGDLSWTAFGVLIFIDFLFMLLLWLDKSNYKYTFVKREDDEFYDA